MYIPIMSNIHHKIHANSNKLKLFISGTFSDTFLTIIQSKLLYIVVSIQFSGRTFGDTQGDGVELPVDYVKVARV